MSTGTSNTNLSANLGMWSYITPIDVTTGHVKPSLIILPSKDDMTKLSAQQTSLLRETVLKLEEAIYQEAHAIMSEGGPEWVASRQEGYEGDNEAFSKRWTRVSIESLHKLQSAGRFTQLTITPYDTRGEFCAALGISRRSAAPAEAYITQEEQTAGDDDESAEEEEISARKTESDGRSYCTVSWGGFIAPYFQCHALVVQTLPYPHD